MASYESFARVYDDFMDNIPYDEWAGYVISLLKEKGIEEGLLLDLGCGTGNITQRLAKSGYDMIGVDNSAEMLEIAQEKNIEEESQILYLLQDMREFELYGTVRAVISICDSMNYIIEYEDLTEVFRLVNNYLDPEGYFIFDMNTLYKYETILADNTIAEDRETMSFIWDNYFYEEERINEYNLNLFLQEEDGRYRKFTETHYQKAYTIDEVKQAITDGGMECIAIYDAFTREAPRKDSQRVYVIAREKGKVERIRDGRLHY
ncbi:MAG: class I SAM-dependent DNA methyltransferase [Candidatus Fimousia sp.]|uniref:class I SAM-dependent DNA methyltransferase n=1 Tax=Anaerostipes sp. 992a TaxID=1261637 RepID=UPI0009510DCD|nr:class I SAM-dependent methyltransferase [Anaerostipes sp. 992a]MDD5969359.1 class I SAM-dependent methyltransferase [Anaerostipes sp.]OLR63599.1 methyltransferase [Anaerostipes sp. 992a]